MPSPPASGSMHWLYRLQQRLQITRRESLAIASLLGLFLTGVVVQEIQERRTPPLAADAFLTPQPPSPALPAAADSHAARSDSLAADRATEDDGASRIDVNRATALQLQALPGIGPALAGRIIDHRSRRPFARTEDLLDVSGIGPKTLVRIAPLVRTGPAPPGLDVPPAEPPVAGTDTVLGPSRSPR